MIVPIRDIAGLQSQKAFRFGHYGLVVVLRGHEELFLEFASAERRDACRHRIEEQLDLLKRLDREAAARSGEQTSGGDNERSSKTAVGSTVSSAKAFDSPVKETLLLGGGLDEPSRSKIEMPSPTGDTETLPPVMFTSANSTFLDFRPTKPLHITCLTIGSRGDVQPCEWTARQMDVGGDRRLTLFCQTSRCARASRPRATRSASLRMASIRIGSRE